MSKIRKGKYRHYRTEKLYEVLGEALNSETQEEMIIYRALYFCETFGDHCVWVRPKSLFLEHLEHQGQRVPRFQWVQE